MHRIRGFIRRSSIGIALALFVSLLCIPPGAQAIIPGSGQIIYSNGSTDPRTREFRNHENTFITESGALTAFASNRWNIMKASPTRNELTLGTVNSDGTLAVQRWDGNQWNTGFTASIGVGLVPRFDIVYETQSGQAIVFYSRNVSGTNEMAYRVWNGSSWTSEIAMNPIRTSGVVQYVRAESRPGTDEVAVIWGDSNMDASANYYNGTTNSFSGEPSSALSTILTPFDQNNTYANRNIDLAFEQVSGRLLVVVGENSQTNTQYYTRSAGSGGTWSGKLTYTPAALQGQGLELSAEPGTNYIGMSNEADWNGSSVGQHVEGSIWNGSAWGSARSHDSTLNARQPSTKKTSGVWLKNGSNSQYVQVYDDQGGSGVDWLTWSKQSSTWTTQSDFTGSPAAVGSGDRLLELYQNPYNQSEAILLQADNNQALLVKKITLNSNGTFSWTSVEPGGTPVETSLTTNTGWIADFAFYDYTPPQNLVSDIVDSGGASIGSPSVTMNSLTSSGTCQTASGTLGGSSQRIRVQNTTGNAPWTLSIAPTGGANARWMASADSYDFNDANGSGCTDGGDSDSFGGQLSLNPSAATLDTNKAGCGTSGVSRGSSSAFADGVVNSITLGSASGSAQIDCYWDFYGASISQKIPGNTLPGSYSLPMTVTTTAS